MGESGLNKMARFVSIVSLNLGCPIFFNSIDSNGVSDAGEFLDVFHRFDIFGRFPNNCVGPHLNKKYRIG